VAKSGCAAGIGQDEKNAGAAAVLRITAVNGNDRHQRPARAPLPSGSTVFNPSTANTTITYTPAANLAGTAAETFTYTISDTVNSDTTTVTVNLSAVNDAPVNRLNGAAISGTPSRNATEDTAFVFNSGNSSVLSIFDVDAGGATNMQVNLVVTSGTLNAVDTAGVTIQNDNTANVTLTGSVANINTALNGLIFNPTGDFNGNVTLTMATTTRVTRARDRSELTPTTSPSSSRP
jgi:hypothetical protein